MSTAACCGLPSPHLQSCLPAFHSQTDAKPWDSAIEFVGGAVFFGRNSVAGIHRLHRAVNWACLCATMDSGTSHGRDEVTWLLCTDGIDYVSAPDSTKNLCSTPRSNGRRALLSSDRRRRPREQLLCRRNQSHILQSSGGFTVKQGRSLDDSTMSASNCFPPWGSSVPGRLRATRRAVVGRRKWQRCVSGCIWCCWCRPRLRGTMHWATKGVSGTRYVSRPERDEAAGVFFLGLPSSRLPSCTSNPCFPEQVR